MPKKSTAGGAPKKKRAKAAKTTSTAKRTTKRAKATKTATKAPRRKRAATPAATTAVSGARLRVRQVRSGIGHAATYRQTLEALGLRHHQDEVVIVDNPSMRGMVRKVRHLVRVTAEEA